MRRLKRKARSPLTAMPSRNFSYSFSPDQSSVTYSFFEILPRKKGCCALTLTLTVGCEHPSILPGLIREGSHHLFLSSELELISKTLRISSAPSLSPTLDTNSPTSISNKPSPDS